MLAPGGISSAESEWDEYFVDPRVLANNFTVITMDQRHAGASRAPLTPFSHDDVFADQVAVLNVLGIQSASIIAADFYCASALKFACDAPARTRSTILIEPMGLDDSNTMDDFYAVFNDTIRRARADGLEGVISAAGKNPIFSQNTEAGPWCQRLHDQPGFAEAIRSLGRETYIALLVDFRDGAFPNDKRYFSVNELEVCNTSVPLLIIPGNDLLHPAGLVKRLQKDTENARISDASRNDSFELLNEIRSFLDQCS
tara:strand:+ start:349 stop:1116 length:768 start_codon:yes stop_codon:yes gene_type:complete